MRSINSLRGTAAILSLAASFGFAEAKGAELIGTTREEAAQAFTGSIIDIRPSVDGAACAILFRDGHGVRETIPAGDHFYTISVPQAGLRNIAAICDPTAPGYISFEQADEAVAVAR